MSGTAPAHFSHAICRRPGPDLAAGLTTAGLGAPDLALARQQHGAYVSALRDCGLDVTVLDPLPGFPDAHFVEDTAVVTPEVAIITRPGHAARRGEEQSIAPELAAYRPVVHIAAPGTVDGGDVLMVGNHFFIGLSERTNIEGATELAAILADYGHTATMVPVAAGLHFKSSVNEVGEALLVTRKFAGRPELADHNCLLVPEGEEYAGNTLRINDRLLMPSGCPGVRRLLEPLGLRTTELDMSEMRKMDGGLTCLSLRF
jgi:dimethylargininase